MAPVFFGTASVLTGKELGFYLGLIVTAIPPIVVFPKLKTAYLFSSLSILVLLLSIVGNMLFSPIAIIPFAMPIFLINLFVVLIITISIVVIFKIELIESREKLFEKK